MEVSGLLRLKICQLIGLNLDLHKGNIAFEISGLDGEPERNVYLTLGSPECVPTLTQNLQSQMNMLPEYLVRPGNLSDFVTRDNLRIKIIDLGEGWSSCDRLFLEH